LNSARAGRDDRSGLLLTSKDTLADALIARKRSFFPRMDVLATLAAERYQIVSGIVSELTPGS